MEGNDGGGDNPPNSNKPNKRPRLDDPKADFGVGGGAPRRRRFGAPSSPPSQQSQRRTQFEKITERLLRVEEQRMELDRSNTELMRTVLEQSADTNNRIIEAVTNLGDRMLERLTERDKMLAESMKVMGEGILALSKSLQQNK